MADQPSSTTEAVPIRDSSSSPLPKAKRRKTQQACSNCRGRKTKCDGQYPICAACERRGVAMTCIYERVQPASHSQRYADLESRLQRLEQGENMDIRSLQSPRFGPDITLADDDSLPPSNTSGIVGHDDRPQNFGHQQVDALATVISDDNDNCVYGESSTIAFVREFTQRDPPDSIAVQNKYQSGDTTREPARMESPALLTPLDISLGNRDNLAILPLRSNADDFLRCYFEFIHPLFPLLHRDSFISQYNQLWVPNGNSKSGKEDIVFMCNLNLVFALGCQFSSLAHSSHRASIANEFYKTSRRVLLYDILGSTSLSVVQWLLLSGVYLQSTSYASHCWNTVGLAIRLAQSLGLHLEYPGSKSESQLKREMRRRIWHTCVVLDKLLAMTFGRPTMVNTSYGTPVPSLIDDEYLRTDGEGIQPKGVNSQMSLFVYSCRLFEILNDILSSFYAVDAAADPVPQSRLQDMVSEVLSFNRRLDDFIISLPGYLKTAQSSQVVISEKNSYTNLQQQVLYCR
ncbi:fungal-specific transcription factor domain-containing protein [Trichoderma evansii]